MLPAPLPHLCSGSAHHIVYLQAFPFLYSQLFTPFFISLMLVLILFVFCFSSSFGSPIGLKTKGEGIARSLLPRMREYVGGCQLGHNILFLRVPATTSHNGLPCSKILLQCAPGPFLTVSFHCSGNLFKTVPTSLPALLLSGIGS